MPHPPGKGSQKQARFERLANEVRKFVYANPGCSAQAIVASLNHDQKMRNHGLTPRKVGFFITRNLRQRPTMDRNPDRPLSPERFAHVGSLMSMVHGGFSRCLF